MSSTKKEKQPTLETLLDSMSALNELCVKESADLRNFPQNIISTSVPPTHDIKLKNGNTKVDRPKKPQKDPKDQCIDDASKTFNTLITKCKTTKDLDALYYSIASSTQWQTLYETHSGGEKHVSARNLEEKFSKMYALQKQKITKAHGTSKEQKAFTGFTQPESTLDTTTSATKPIKANAQFFQDNLGTKKDIANDILEKVNDIVKGHVKDYSRLDEDSVSNIHEAILKTNRSTSALSDLETQTKIATAIAGQIVTGAPGLTAKDIEGVVDRAQVDSGKYFQDGKDQPKQVFTLQQESSNISEAPIINIPKTKTPAPTLKKGGEGILNKLKNKLEAFLPSSKKVDPKLSTNTQTIPKPKSQTPEGRGM